MGSSLLNGGDIEAVKGIAKVIIPKPISICVWGDDKGQGQAPLPSSFVRPYAWGLGGDSAHKYLQISYIVLNFSD